MIRTLIVDDDFMVAEIHGRFTERVQGFSVVGVAHSAREALAAIDSLKPDLVVLDVYLPDRSGLDVLREVRGVRTPTDVIIVTAANDMATVQQAMQSGIVHYIMKPFDFGRFERTLLAYRRLRLAREAGGPIAQEDVDRLFTLGAAPAVTTLPKGLNRPTLDRVVSFLESATAPRSATEIGAAIGVSRVTARRYLEYLERQGYAELTPRYGGAGRPENLYRATGG